MHEKFSSRKNLLIFRKAGGRQAGRRNGFPKRIRIIAEPASDGRAVGEVIALTHE
jgi:hypothetical protein